MEQEKFTFYLDKARGLLELEEKILSFSDDIDIEIFIELFEEFYDGVKEIRDAFIDIEALPIDISNTDSTAIDFLQAVLNNDPFEDVEKKKDKIAIKYFFKMQFLFKRMNQLMNG